MKLKMSEAHNLYSALQRMDNDPSLKLNDEAQLAIVINLNRLLIPVQAYEKLRNAAYIELRKDGVKDEALWNAQFTARDIELREIECEISDLKMIRFDDLKPAKGEHFIAGKAHLRPIISDWPE